MTESRVYRVLLERFVAHEASVDVEADSPGEAAELAKQRSDDGMVAWTTVNDETRSQVEP